MATLKALMTVLSKQGLQEERREIIWNFTQGRTCFARELTQLEINELHRKLQNKDDELDKLRKRLIAAIFGTLSKLNQKDASIEYVKAIACRAAGVKSFNRISKMRLISIYNAFLKAQKDADFATNIVDIELYILGKLN